MRSHLVLLSTVVCVSDSFHFSSFYWRESSASLAGMDRETDDDSVAGANVSNGRSSRSGTIDETESPTEQPVLKVRILVCM